MAQGCREIAVRCGREGLAVMAVIGECDEVTVHVGLTSTEKASWGQGWIRLSKLYLLKASQPSKSNCRPGAKTSKNGPVRVVLYSNHNTVELVNISLILKERYLPHSLHAQQNTADPNVAQPQLLCSGQGFHFCRRITQFPPPMRHKDLCLRGNGHPVQAQTPTSQSTDNSNVSEACSQFSWLDAGQ